MTNFKSILHPVKYAVSLDKCCCSQEKSHLLATRVTCASFSATTWTDTRGCTAERSRISVIAAIRLVVSVQLICFTCTFGFLDVSQDLAQMHLSQQCQWHCSASFDRNARLSLPGSRTSHGQTGC